MSAWPLRVRLTVLPAGLAVAVLALVRAGPPAPALASAPADRFSAGRAGETLAALLDDQAPHPVGSAANAAVRARLAAALRGLGIEPEEQRAFSCSEAGACAFVTNLIAWLPGQVPGPALALLSHHDSVPAGPGAADDGHGVALVLEVLRALGAGPHRAPLVAVFTDGEEMGLLGARAFTRHPRFGEIGVVINAEARGTAGPARMFETSDGNAALIAALAAARRPSALSLSYEIYRRLPNDTDLTIFKRHGVQGMNFAFIGGVQRYHTPRDDLAHLDRGSLQQQGDGVLASARALLAEDLSVRPEHNASYADLLGLVLLRWPAWLDLPLAVLALLALLVAAGRGLMALKPTPVSADRSSAASPASPGSSPELAASAVDGGPTTSAAGARLDASPVRAAGGTGLATSAAETSAPAFTAAPRPPRLASVLALGVVLLAPLVGAAAGHGAIWLIERLSGPLGPWPASLGWPQLAIACAALAAVLPLLRLAARRAGAQRQACATWVVWTLVAVALAWTIPGATILALAPALLVAPLSLAPRTAPLLAGLAALLACALWCPLAPALSDALGLSGLLVGALVGWLATVLAPFCADGQGDRFLSRTTWLILLLGLVAGVLAARSPRVDVDHPAKLNLIHLTDLDAGTAVFLADAPAGLPPEFAAVTTWGPAEALLPWSARAFPSARAEPLPGEGPTLTAYGPDTFLLRARPGALAVVLQIPGDSLAALTVAGQPLDPEALRRGPSDTRLVTIYGPPPGGVELTISRRSDAPWRLAELVSGLPLGSPADHRPDTAVPYQWGDLTVAVRTHTF